MPGFFLNGGNCNTACAASAAHCHNATNDLTCKEGFTLAGITSLVC